MFEVVVGVDQVAAEVAPRDVRGGGKSAGPPRVETLILTTNLLDAPAEVIALVYEHRWGVELIIRFFKQVLGCRHLISDDPRGVSIQCYCAVIACLLLTLWSGRQADKATWRVAGWFLTGLADEAELLAHLSAPDNRGVKLAAKDALWKKLGYRPARHAAPATTAGFTLRSTNRIGSDRPHPLPASNESPAADAPARPPDATVGPDGIGSTYVRRAQPAASRLGRNSAAAAGRRRTPRDRVVHSRQRVYGVLVGYEDCNDHDALRDDPPLTVRTSGTSAGVVGASPIRSAAQPLSVLLIA